MASRDTDPVPLEKRKQKLRDLMAEEKQKHELKMKGWSDKLRELDAIGKYRGPQVNGTSHLEQPQASGAFLPDDAEHSNEYESRSSSASAYEGPPGFPGSAWDTSAHIQAPQNGNTSLSNGGTHVSAAWSASQPQPNHHSPALAAVTPQGTMNVFHRLGQTPSAHQQTDASPSLKSQTSANAAINHFDHPPGFAGPESLTAQPISQDCEIPPNFVMSAPGTAQPHDQDLPPGFPTSGSSSAQQPNRRSGMRSDQAPYSARSQDSGSHSAKRGSPSPGQPPPNSGAPPGFAGLPAYLAQRLSPAPAQQPAGVAHQASVTSLRAAPGGPSTAGIDTSGPAVTQDDSLDEAPPGFARAGSSSLPFRPSAELRDRGSTAGLQSSSASAHEEAPPGYGAQPARQLPADGWGGSSNRNGAQPSTSREDTHGGEEFPGLAFGIKDLDQQQKFSSADSSQDFPSLGGPAGADGGSKPAGAWGKGPGQLAGSLRQQQQQHQVSSVAATLAAAVRPPQPPTLHVERVELNDGLRVRGDDASDSVRKKRSRKHEFEKWERVKGMGSVNIVEGLELHENVLSPEEQANMVATIEQWVVQGKQGRLKGRTFSAPRKWARGKGRITCQFGCCYNYAIDSEGRKPGIVAEEVVEKMPPVLVSLCKRLVRWGILPKHKEPDTAIINVYDVEDCIPPHIDHHDFDRPFCTISLLSQQNIMFGSKIISRGPGDFVADYEMPLPTGSCLVLKGNGADVAQHCVPPVSARRMSITLRRMQDVHARRVVAMAERVHAGLPVDTDNPPSGPQRLTGDDAYDMEERREASYGSKRR